MNLTDSYTTANQKPAAKLADLAYIRSERAASHETAVLLDFVTEWMKQRDYKLGLASLDLLLAKKCDPEADKRARMRQDGETPSIIHELSQAIYTISLVETGYPLPDTEDLLCLNFTHDLGEEFDVSRQGFIDNLTKHGIPATPRVEALADMFENMTKSRNDIYKYDNNQSYFLKMLEHPTTVIAKFQDRIHNMATLIGVKKPHKHREYIVETMELRATLNQAKTTYPAFAAVFDIMNKIVAAQIHFNTGYLNRAFPENPISTAGQGIITRLNRIAQLPAGLDPLQIPQTRSNAKLAWSVARQEPSPSV